MTKRMCLALVKAGLLEELVDVLELAEPQLMEIRAAALRTLTAIIHLDRNPNFIKLNTIIDVTGAALYHGFLPVLVRSCIGSLTGQQQQQHLLHDASAAATAATVRLSFPFHFVPVSVSGAMTAAPSRVHHSLSFYIFVLFS